MTALEQLNAYLRRLESRFRALAVARGAAAVAALAFGLTILLVWIANRYQFADQVVLPLRILLFVAIAAAVAFALAIPFLRANRRRLTRLAETRVPEFEQRLLTAERQDPENPFAEIVAEDTLRIAREHQPEEFAPSPLLYSFAGAAAAVIAVLIWTIAAGPGYWGYGAALLWTGKASASRRPLYEIAVQPGNRTVRRNADQAITARLLGFSAPAVVLHARYNGALKWETTQMRPQPEGNGYRFLFAGLSDGVEYYVQAGAKQSPHYRLAVRDLPAVKAVHARLHFPPDLGLHDVTTPSGDIRAVIGAEADLSVLTDKPLAHGALIFRDGSRIPLSPGAGSSLATHLAIQKSGIYHVAAIQGGEAIRISGDYFIEARPDEPPTVKIQRPGRDTHVSPIEEVPVSVSASDDFGLEGVTLHYSVDGGPETTVPLLRHKGDKLASGNATLYLENFKLVPGDIVSYYATARDVKANSRSDIFFAQVEPFDMKFSQSQQSAGMGGGGGQAQDVVERQKEIIAATYNELKRKDKSRAALDEDARMLAQTQAKLSQQEKTLAQRMGARELTESQHLAEMSKLMNEAAGHMDRAAKELQSAKWNTALPPEEKAFQSLNRIEAMYRNFQVAFGQMGGAAMNGARRDLARMFDLEMDLSKNQYETGQSADQSASTQQKALDEAFARLQALARRQQQLAMERRGQKAFEQRWQEELLRRQAEQLRQQMQQMMNGSQNGQQSASSPPSGSSASSQGASSGSQMNDAMRQAAQALQQAEQEMRQAAGGKNPGAEQRAAEQLARAQEALDRALHRQAEASLSDLTQQAQQLADAQRRIEQRMKQMYGPSSMNPYSPNRQSANANGQSANANGGVPMPQMNDPLHPIPYGYGNYWYRRRYLERFTPPHMPSGEERNLSNQKDQLAEKVQQLERQLEDQVQRMAAAQPDAAAKLRQALAALQQEDIPMRMRKSAQWMRQGFGGRNLSTEDSMTDGLQQLSRDLGQTQQAIRSGAPGNSGQSDNTQQALNDLRALREQMQQAQQPGGKGSAGQQGNEPGEDGAWAPLGGGGPGVDRDNLKAAITDLNRLRAQMRPNDHSYRDLDYALGYLVRLYHADPNVLRAAINEDTVTNLERLEMELSQHANNGKGISGARTSAPEPVPQKYRQAVADYFEKLSR